MRNELTFRNQMWSPNKSRLLTPSIKNYYQELRKQMSNLLIRMENTIICKLEMFSQIQLRVLTLSLALKRLKVFNIRLEHVLRD